MSTSLILHFQQPLFYVVVLIVRKVFKNGFSTMSFVYYFDDENAWSDMEVMVIMTTAGPDLTLFTIVTWKNHVPA